ncbi:MAG: hypothetical protein NC038_05455 [Paludibacter sp.]|nr:hypothetical protein [Bacteroidales bacterium]MCM1069817.1 hypothetical protein [Prevotella sp.]MCM1353989.1 hypothetical protein [Bacteroides sp.]MCM1443369.1 hypothetical protein [Muribaculum sp.]MCM1482072.1 hypothetical protein [Paludibacter sp.]
MARTISQIKQELTAAFMADKQLQDLYGWQDGATFDKTFSKVAIESLLLYIVSAAIWTLEKLMDTHRQEVEDYIATMKPHSLRWYTEKAKAFLYGLPLIEGTDQYNTTGLTDEEITEKQIVHHAACSENNATLYMRVAKVGPAPLSEEERTAFLAYLHEVKDAGVRIDVISQEGDYLRLALQVYYNPMLLNANGTALADGAQPVEEAIKQYIESLPFDGEFRTNSLVDAIQAVPGVEMLTLTQAQHCEDGINYQPVNAFCKPVAGYFKYNRDGQPTANITYIPYGQD